MPDYKFTIDSKWARGSDSTWVNDQSIWSGTPSQGGNYRTCISFSTKGLVIAKSSKLVVRITTSGDSKSSPKGCTAYLTLKPDPDLAPGEVQNGNATGPNSMLESISIASSPAYKNAEGTKYSGESEASGTPFYFIFNTDQIRANEDYCIYLTRNTIGNSWVQSVRPNVNVTLTYESYTKCSTPAYFTAPRLFEDTIDLEWGESVGGINNPVTEYVVKCYIIEKSSLEWIIFRVDGNTTRVSIPTSQITGVADGDGVGFFVHAIGEAGNPYNSNQVHCQSKKNSRPSNPVSKVSTTEKYLTLSENISLEWGSSRDADNNLNGYRLSRTPLSGETPDVDGKVTVSLGTSLARVFSTISRVNDKMDFYVRAEDELGAVSDWEYLATVYNIEECTPPQLFTAELSPKEDYISIFWAGATGCRYNYIKGYRVYLEYSLDGISWSNRITVASFSTDPAVFGIQMGSVFYLESLEAKYGVPVSSVKYYKFYIETVGSARTSDPATTVLFRELSCFQVQTSEGVFNLATFIFDGTFFNKYVPFRYNGAEWSQELQSVPKFSVSVKDSILFIKSTDTLSGSIKDDVLFLKTDSRLAESRIVDGVLVISPKQGG